MFSPLGFITVQNFWLRCHLIGQEKANALGLKYQEEMRFLPDGMTDWKNNHSFIAHLWGEFYFERVLKGFDYEVFVCSPPDSILWIDDRVAELVREHDFHPEDPIEQAMQHFLDNYQEGSRFVFFDEATSMVRMPSVELSPEQEPLWGAFVNFIGWSVCLREEALPKTLIEFDALNWRSAGQKARPIGRPRKVDMARQVYDSIFPNGHETDGLSWKEAVRMVEEKSGVTSLSITTLQRALGKRS